MNAILLAAGDGKRSGLSFPKQLLKIRNKPMFILVIEQLLSVQEIDTIILTVPPNMLKDFEAIINTFNLLNIVCVEGGDTRQKSVYNSLKYCSSERILIHVASRPFVTKEHIQELISYDADVVVPYVPVLATAFHAGGYYIDRDILKSIQVPQIYKTQILKSAHELAKSENYSEDSQLVFEKLGIMPLFVKGLQQNIKITYPIDVQISKNISNTVCL